MEIIGIKYLKYEIKKQKNRGNKSQTVMSVIFVKKTLLLKTKYCYS